MPQPAFIATLLLTFSLGIITAVGVLAAVSVVAPLTPSWSPVRLPGPAVQVRPPDCGRIEVEMLADPSEGGGTAAKTPFSLDIP
jgi:hypothetical protein